MIGLPPKQWIQEYASDDEWITRDELDAVVKSIEKWTLVRCTVEDALASGIDCVDVATLYDIINRCDMCSQFLEMSGCTLCPLFVSGTACYQRDPYKAIFDRLEAVEFTPDPRVDFCTKNLNEIRSYANALIAYLEELATAIDAHLGATTTEQGDNDERSE